jgi:hypothetical protein
MLRGILLTVVAVSCAAGVQAQTYPDRPIRLIAPFPAGGLADVLARAVGDQMQKSLGQPIVVENRAGAGGNTGAAAVAQAAPDGYTLLMSSAGILTANPHLYAKMPFDVETAFIPVSNVAEMNMLVVVHPNVPAKTLKEFVALARTQPGKLNFGSPGVGTTGHLGLAMLMHAAQVRITHVPYKGAAPAVTDLIAGQIDGVVDNPPTVICISRPANCARWLTRQSSACHCCRTCPPRPKPESPTSRQPRGSASQRRPGRRRRLSRSFIRRSPPPSARRRWPSVSPRRVRGSSAIRRSISPPRSVPSVCNGARSSRRPESSRNNRSHESSEC